MDTKRIKHLLTADPAGQEIMIEGWVRTKRDSKGVCFFEINDGSCMKNLQAIIDKETVELQDAIDRMGTGASVRVSGKLVESPGKNQKSELNVHGLEILGEAPAESYPLQKKRHSFEYLREIAHLRPRTNTFGAVARVRNAMSYAIHSFFQERDFLYIHTPIITGSDAEGAGEMFQVTTLPIETLAGSAEAVEIDYSHDFFGKKSSLTVSGQLEGEIYALAMKNIYTFGPTFRAENSNTSRHLAEFWMIEPEMAFCDIEGNMELAEDFLKYILSYLLEQCGEDMEFFDLRIQKGLLEQLEAIIKSDFSRITYTEAISALEKAKTEFEFPVSWGCDLQSEHEKYLTEEVYGGPVVVTDYPQEIKAFYMKLNEDGKTVRAMDVLVPRLGEIIGGSEREADLETLEKRIDAADLHRDDYWWYLDLRRFGTVPHAGFGLGFERLIQYVTGMQNIRDVIPFPRTVKNAEF
jgi:asparaginyl-tRNA synthetase